MTSSPVGVEDWEKFVWDWVTTVDGRLFPTVLDVGVGLSGSLLGGDGGIMNDVAQPNKQRRMKLRREEMCAMNTTTARRRRGMRE